MQGGKFHLPVALLAATRRRLAAGQAEEAFGLFYLAHELAGESPCLSLSFIVLCAGQGVLGVCWLSSTRHAHTHSPALPRPHAVQSSRARTSAPPCLPRWRAVPPRQACCRACKHTSPTPSARP